MAHNKTQWVDHIPVLYVEPEGANHNRQLVIFLHHFSGKKERMMPVLEELAAQGYTALSFDAWQHGERGNESEQQIFERVFENFRHEMWPILGNTTLDVLRVIDWAIATLDVKEEIYLAGLSMGGDIAVAAAGIDKRIKRVAAVIATPDWLRPDMEDRLQSGNLIPVKKADSYAQYFYDQLNPLTHLSAYAHGPEIHFICGADDTHVRPDGAIRFHSLLRDNYPSAADNIEVTLLENFKHLDARDVKRWWPQCLAWLMQK